MRPVWTWLAVAGVALLLGAAACGERVEAGLANAPSMERTSVPTRHHDVIANGDDSCPHTPGAGDPLHDRAPPCVDLFPEAGTPVGDGGITERDSSYASERIR